MSIFLNILFLVIGMILLIKGADYFVSGASAVAKKMKIPAMFIGLTIVAIGTSLPELSVSITSAIKNDVDLSLSNVIGSNMCNTFLILGCVGLFSKIKLGKSTKKLDFPFLIAITTVLGLFAADSIINGSLENILSRSESIILIITLILYFFILISNAQKERKQQLEASGVGSFKSEKKNVLAEDFAETYKENLQNDQENINEYNTEENTSNEKNLKIWQILLYITIGLTAVIFGGECVSTTAKFLAIKAGMSETLVGLTIVAIGTSLPEMVTSIVAAKKGENDIALGNVIGSNIINIALILGIAGIITQVSVSSQILFDLIVLIVYTLIFTLICAKKSNLGKSEAWFLLLMYFAYIAFAIVRNYCF